MDSTQPELQYWQPSSVQMCLLFGGWDSDRYRSATNSPLPSLIIICGAREISQPDGFHCLAYQTYRQFGSSYVADLEKSRIGLLPYILANGESYHL